MIKIAIVEDDNQYVRTLKQFLSEYGKTNNQEFDIKIFNNGVDFISDYKIGFDLVLMDIEMPHMNGLDTAKKLRKIDSDVVLVFVTNMSQYALMGYEVDAVDYIVKPVDYYNFSVKLKKALKACNNKLGKKIVINTPDSIRCLNSNQIYYIEVIGHSIIYYTQEGDFTTYNKLSVLEKEYEEYNFIRCHKSFMVNLKYVTEVKNSYVFLGSREVPLSRGVRKTFLQKLSNYLSGGEL